MLQSLDEQHLNSLVGEVLAEGLGDLVVTPKEVDMLIDDAAGIIADGVNLAINKGLSIEDVSRYLH